jgi:transposase
MAPSPAAVQGLGRAAEGLPGEESGRRGRGQWHGLPVASPERLTSSAVHAKGGHAAREARGLLGPCRGTGVHAHWNPSGTDAECAQARCHAHHWRERRGLDTQ